VAANRPIVLAVVFQPYGPYGRKSAPISVGTLSELTGRDRAQVSRALGSSSTKASSSESAPAG
jgi:hypothetical protein